MGLTMNQRQTVTKTNTTRYKRAQKGTEGRDPGRVVRLTDWHRNRACRVLRQGLPPKVVRLRRPRATTSGADVVVALPFCWAVLGAPTGKRLAP